MTVVVVVLKAEKKINEEFVLCAFACVSVRDMNACEGVWVYTRHTHA